MKILIVGGVAGGAAFAARLRRLDEKAEITVFERGGYVSFANCGLPYYAGEVIRERSELIIATPEFFKARFNVDVLINREVIDIDREKKEVTVRNCETLEEYKENYDKLMLSPGADPVIPPFEGVDLNCVHTVRTIPDIDRIKEKLDAGKVGNAVVIGAGFIGVEMAENLRDRGVKVSLIERMDQVMPPFDKDMAVMLSSQLAFQGIKLYLEEDVVKIKDLTDSCVVVSKSGERIPADMVILAVGVSPETTLATSSGLAVGKKGIVVNDRMQTSDPDIFAVGDAVEVDNPMTGSKWSVPLAWPAAKEAVVAANNLCGIEDRYEGTQGTSVVKIFSLTAAMTGATEKMLKQAGKKYKKIYTHPANHAGYYPGASQMSMKVLYDPDSGVILGAQIVGQDGVDKRVNVLSLAVRHSLTIEDMANEEFCYAPPYGSAKDAVNLMGMAALNIERGLTETIHWEDIEGDELLLDVRTVEEVECGAIDGSVNIPLDILRERMRDLPKEQKIAVFCQVGIRGHIACRILSQSGYTAVNLSGGYLTYRNYIAAYVDKEVRVSDVDEIGRRFCTGPTGDPVTAAQEAVETVDVRGVQCPGPILKLKSMVEQIEIGQVVKVISNDIGFSTDLPSWCESTGNLLVKLENKGSDIEAMVMKQKKAKGDTVLSQKGTTMVVFSGDMDKVLASFIIARSAVAAGDNVTMFFTFWGLNSLRKNKPPRVSKDILSRMFGMMMPSSAAKLKLSKLNMLGVGTALMKYVMRSKNVDSLEDLMAGAISDGVRLVACSMSMDVMGISREELIDGVDIGGAAAYVASANKANHTLFI